MMRNAKTNPLENFLTQKPAQLLALSVKYGWSLNKAEMTLAQQHFQKLGRPPLRGELETIAQTWSEHCKHKTFSGPVKFTSGGKTEKIPNLFKETIVLATALTLHAQSPAPAAAPAAPAAAPAPTVKATPALWVVKGPKATLYLFGTIHILKPNIDWHTPAVTSALAASSSLLEEVDNVDDPNAIRPLMMQLGMDQEHPLSTKITKEDLAAIDSALKQMGAPGESAVEPLRPWLVGITLSVLPMLKAGYDPQSGVDLLLTKDFKAANKPVKGLETIEQQLHFFSDLSPTEEVSELHEQLKHLDTGTQDLDKILAAWQKGDPDTIASIENDDFRKDYPALYDKLVIARNKAWADKLATLLQGDGTTFMAVGAAHLAGPDSVLQLLATRGFTITRL